MALKRLSHRHDRIIDWLVMNPHRTLGECARFFGYTQPWLTQIVHSGAFQVAYARRCRELGQQAVHTIVNKMAGVAALAFDAIGEKIANGVASDRLLTDTTSTVLQALGYINRGAQVNVNSGTQVEVRVDSQYLEEVRERVLQRIKGQTALKAGDGHHAETADTVSKRVN